MQTSPYGLSKLPQHPHTLQNYCNYNSLPLFNQGLCASVNNFFHFRVFYLFKSFWSNTLFDKIQWHSFFNQKTRT